MCNRKYSKEIFIHNIEVLVKYNWEPEVEIVFIDKKKILIIAYKDFVDYINTNLIKRITAELKKRGQRNTKKQRGGPHMRGFFWLPLLLEDNNENS